MSKIALIAATLVLGASVQAQMTFQFTFSGAPANTATAVGTITFAAGNPPNPGSVLFSPLAPAITALSVTVAGASVGNGVFGTASFSSLVWDTAGATLNLTTELVGQSTGAGVWGTTAGDFNLFTAGIDAAPNGIGPNTLAADGGSGDQMTLTSFAPVPEPHEYALMAGLGLLGFVAWRRRRSA